MTKSTMEHPNEMNKDAKGKYANVNGLNLYYETYGGIGQPLVLLHGGLGVIGMFAQLLPSLAETRQVIAVELQAHGHTVDIDRPLSFEFMADDIARHVYIWDSCMSRSKEFGCNFWLFWTTFGTKKSCNSR